MNYHLISQIVIISVTVLILIYDLFAKLSKQQKATISEIIWEWSKRYPFIPFGFGLLMGHFFL